MKKKQFILKYCRIRKIDRDNFEKHLDEEDLVVLKCDCDYEKCGGWRVDGIENI